MSTLITAIEENIAEPPLAIVQNELQLLESFLQDTLLSENNQNLNQVSNFLLQAPGKRLRPTMVFLAGQINANGHNLVPIGAAVELLHMATLIHDDIIDQADIRRGQKSVNAKFGSHVAVLMGDYCYGKSLELISALGDDYTRLMAEIINNLVSGEFVQYDSIREPYLAMESYWQRIFKKTAFFFAVSCRMGAMASGAATSTVEILSQYGECLGMAYQIKDDLMDIIGDCGALGKPVGNDMKNGVLTLPLIHALNFSKQSAHLKALISTENATIDHELVKSALLETGALEYTRDALEQYIALALQSLQMLPASSARSAMEHLASSLAK